jgi:sugar phosphate isomerase/epimerase
MDRRSFIAGSAMMGISSQVKLPKTTQTKRYQNGRSPWPVCLDTATIRPATLLQKIEIAEKAGYDALEPWDMELREYEDSGGNLKDLGKMIRDKDMFVPSMIGLWGCIPDSEEKFKESLKVTRERMRMASDIGCEFVQAIPNKVGDNYDHAFVSQCYRELLEIGINDYGVKPALVFVKMFPIKTLGQAAAVALDADHPEARIIPDVYHMYISKGGFNSLKDLNGDLFAIFQYNDAPGGMALADMEDKHRVFPGDGILPLAAILRDLKATGFNRCVSLELYNPEYHKRDLLEVAKTGLEKTLLTIEEAGV